MASKAKKQPANKRPLEKKNSSDSVKEPKVSKELPNEDGVIVGDERNSQNIKMVSYSILIPQLLIFFLD